MYIFKNVQKIRKAFFLLLLLLGKCLTYPLPINYQLLLLTHETVSIRSWYIFNYFILVNLSKLGVISFEIIKI